MEPYKINHKTHFNEQYSVKINRLKDNGFWEIIEEDVYVKVKHGVNEKNNHAEAAELIKTKYSDCEIISVKYC